MNDLVDGNPSEKTWGQHVNINDSFGTIHFESESFFSNKFSSSNPSTFGMAVYVKPVVGGLDSSLQQGPLLPAGTNALLLSNTFLLCRLLPFCSSPECRSVFLSSLTNTPPPQHIPHLPA